MNLKKIIRQHILENFLFTEDESVLHDNDSFLNQGIIDSTGILEIILFIEETFDIKVNNDEMVPANFDSVDILAAYVKRKQTLAA